MNEQGQVETPTAVTRPLAFPGRVANKTANAASNGNQTEVTNHNASGPSQMASDPSIDEMSVEELERHNEEVSRKLREKKEAEKKAIIKQIVEVVTAYDIPIEELVDALGGLKIRRKGVKAVQKCRDPATGVTWSGRGKEPSWIRGKDRRKFLIPGSE